MERSRTLRRGRPHVLRQSGRCSHIARVLGLLTALVSPGASRAVHPEDLGTGLVLRDSVGRTWENERVSLVTRDFPAGLVRPEEVQCLDGSGRSVPSQLDEIALHPDGSLLRARVWALVTLPADGTVALRLARGRSPVPEQPATATRSDEGIVLDDGMGRMALHVPAARTLDTPVALSDLPAPIRDVRLSDGRWAGRGQLRGTVPISSCHAAVAAHGPLFAAASVHYQNQTGAHYTATITVLRGEPVALIDEEFDLPAAQDGPESMDLADPTDGRRIPTFEFTLSEKFRPDAARFKAHTASPPCQTIQPLRAGAEAAYDLPLSAARRTFSLAGYMAWHPDLGAYWMAYEKGAGPDSPVLAIVPMCPGRWFNPTGIQVWTDPRRGVFLSAPLGITHRRSWEVDGVHDTEMETNIHSGILNPALPRHLGRRCWALATLPQGTAASQDYRLDQSPIQKLVNRLSKLPLDKVKDWTLDWDSAGVRYPRLFGPGEAPTARPAAPAESQKAIDAARTWIRNTVEGIGADGHTTFHLGLAQNLFGVLEEMDRAMARPGVPAEEARARKAQAAFLTSMICDDQFMPVGAGFHIGNPNMPLASECYVGLAGCMMPTHPRAAAWVSRAVAKLAVLFERYSDPVSGAWEECPHYMMDASLRQAFTAFVALRHSGYGDLWQWPTVKRVIRYTFGILSPPDPRFGIRILGTQGNGSTEGATLLGWAAAAYRFTDPELSAECQWMWDADGRQTIYPGSTQVIQPDLPSKPPVLRSAHYRGFGAVLRNGFPDPNETWFCYRHGRMISHYEDGDQGSWHLYAKGAPLSLDFSSQYGPMNWRPWLHNRISIDHKTDPMILSEHDVDEFITTWLADFVSGRSVIDRLRAMSETPYETLPDGSSAGPEEKIPPVTWRRSVIFVKDSDLLGPNYFLIRDRLDSATRPADWSCWCLAESVRFDGRTARFQGQYRVDLDVVRIEPAAAAWVQDRSPVPPPPTVAKLSYGPGVAGWPEACRNPPDAHPPVLSHDFTYLRPFWQKQNPGKPFEERQLCARIRLPAGQGCLMLLYPRRREGEEIPAVAPWAGGGAALSFRNARHFVLSMPGDAEVRADGVRAHAAAFAVRQSPSGISLALLRGTRLSYQGLEIEGVGPVCLEVAGRRVRGEISGAARSVQFQLPRELSAGTSLKVDGQTRGRVARGGFTIDVPAGEHTFEVVNESP